MTPKKIVIGMVPLKNVAPDFFQGVQQTDNLVARLASGARGHRSRVKTFKGLKDAAANGQKPHYAIYYNGPTSGPAFLGLAPSQAFCASDLFLVLPQPQKGRVPPPIIAAAEFAQKLGVKHHVMVFNSAVDMDYFARGAKATGPFIAAWKKNWELIVAEVKKTAPQKKAAGTALHRRIGEDILLTNAALLERTLGIKVTPFYYDAEVNTLTGYTRPKTGAAFTLTATVPTTLPHFVAKKGFPRALGCSCCDSRALHGHMYCAQPGEFLESNSIAAIIPPATQIRSSREPHSIWAKIEYAHEVLGIREYSVTGHSKCGGAEALVGWCRTGKPVGGYIGGWLAQAYEVVRDAVDFAKKDRFFKEPAKLCLLAEMRITQWSARNLKDYSPQSQVLPLFLDIETRRIYPLPAIDPKDQLNQSLAKTALVVRALYAGSLLNLSEVEAAVERLARLKQKKIASSLIAARIKE